MSLLEVCGLDKAGWLNLLQRTSHGSHGHGPWLVEPPQKSPPWSRLATVSPIMAHADKEVQTQIIA